MSQTRTARLVGYSDEDGVQCLGSAETIVLHLDCPPHQRALVRAHLARLTAH